MRVTKAAMRPTPSGVAEGVPIPAPVGGWDGISPLANMPIDRAYQLDNWIPKPGWIEPRKGFVPWATGVGNAMTPVQTVMSYSGSGSVNKLFAVAGGQIYDCSLQGVAQRAIKVGSSRLQHIMYSNPSEAVDYLIAVTGADSPKAFDGSNWQDLTITGDNFDPATFIHVASHKDRLWFVPANSTGVVYLETVGGIQGEGSLFPLGQLMSKGGYIQAVGTWTVDANQYVDEYIAFVSSRGQVMVYQGTDPSTQATWSLVGVYNIGAPVGRRCLLKISGDLLIITLDGVVPMTEMLETDRDAAQKVSLTQVIMNPMAQAAQSYNGNFGWELTAYAKGTLVILNIPIAENYKQMQFVMNTITGAWARFFDPAYGGGIPANSWEVDAQDRIFFGGNNGTVYQWDIGSGDNGSPINCTVKTAYNGFGNAAQLKRYTMCQPLFTTTGDPIPAIGINVDFQDSAQLSIEQPIDPGYPKWDAAKWDQFVWPVLETTKNSWISVYGFGHYVSVVTIIQTSPRPSNPTQATLLQLNGWNILAERGAFV